MIINSFLYLIHPLKQKSEKINLKYLRVRQVDMLERIEWEMIDKDRIEVRINGRRGLVDKKGKFIDAFTQKTFEINPEELLTFQRAFSNMMFDYCAKFKCKLAQMPE